MEKNPNEEKSIILIGFMGVGKTTAGKLLAEKLKRGFVDVDQEIEDEYQMPIKDIFQRFGEEAFRQIEKETVIYYAKQRHKVISLGGGAFMQKEIRDACLEKGIVLHLDISWEIWRNRMGELIDNRPVLQSKTMKEIETLFYDRRNTYSENHSKIWTDACSEEEVAEKIRTMINLSSD